MLDVKNSRLNWAAILRKRELLGIFTSNHGLEVIKENADEPAESEGANRFKTG